MFYIIIICIKWCVRFVNVMEYIGGRGYAQWRM